MALFDRIVGVPGTTKISVHNLSAAFREWEAGKVSRADIIAAFALQADDLTQLDQLKAIYAGKSAEKKAEFVDLFEAIGLLAETHLLGYDDLATFTARLQNF